MEFKIPATNCPWGGYLAVSIEDGSETVILTAVYGDNNESKPAQLPIQQVAKAIKALQRGTTSKVNFPNCSLHAIAFLTKELNESLYSGKKAWGEEIYLWWEGNERKSDLLLVRTQDLLNSLGLTEKKSLKKWLKSMFR